MASAFQCAGASSLEYAGGNSQGSYALKAQQDAQRALAQLPTTTGKVQHLQAPQTGPLQFQNLEEYLQQIMPPQAFNPQGVYQQPQGAYQQPQGVYQQPQGAYQQPQGAYQQPQGAYQQPQGAYQQLQGFQQVQGSPQANPLLQPLGVHQQQPMGLAAAQPLSGTYMGQAPGPRGQIVTASAGQGIPPITSLSHMVDVALKQFDSAVPTLQGPATSSVQQQSFQSPLRALTQQVPYTIKLDTGGRILYLGADKKGENLALTTTSTNWLGVPHINGTALQLQSTGQYVGKNGTLTNEKSEAIDLQFENIGHSTDSYSSIVEVAYPGKFLGVNLNIPGQEQVAFVDDVGSGFQQGIFLFNSTIECKNGGVIQQKTGLCVCPAGFSGMTCSEGGIAPSVVTSTNGAVDTSLDDVILEEALQELAQTKAALTQCKRQCNGANLTSTQYNPKRPGCIIL